MSTEDYLTEESTRSEQDPTSVSVQNASSKATRSRASWRSQDVLLFLIALRLLNALVLRTFFQPDEYYQALEPAWQLAFGNDAGAWITWEWKEHLRSAIHPSLFAAVYQVNASLADLLHLGPTLRAELLLAGPKVLQALIAAVGDFYTWRLGKQVYGAQSKEALVSLYLTVLSPWQWFCSTRTFSNCLETTLTVLALYNWPFHWALQDVPVDRKVVRTRETDDKSVGTTDEATRIRRAIIFASIATILRPTNALIWLTLVTMTFGTLAHSSAELLLFLREALTCGSLVLGLSILVDRIFYGTWTLPPLNFLRFNVLQSVAVFYGNNDWHYYLSQGYPLLLMAALPFGVIGVLQALSNASQPDGSSLQTRGILRQLSVVTLILPGALSVLSHKEVRFIYPLLPILHVLASHSLAKFAESGGILSNPSRESQKSKLARPALFVLLSVNLVVAAYVSLVHNSGINSLPDYFRDEFETFYGPSAHSLPSADQRNLTFALLMPCHSTPWRSHLQYSPTLSQHGISGWALTCEPPLNMEPKEKEAYLDEADIFYADPTLWIRQHMSLRLPKSADKAAGLYVKRERRKLWGEVFGEDVKDNLWLEQGDGGHGVHGKRAWPEYLAFFQHLEPILQSNLRGSGYKECARFFNSHFHDDWRRTGDVIVWCLYPERSNPVDRKASSIWSKLSSFQTAKTPTRSEVEDALHGTKQRAQKILGR